MMVTDAPTKSVRMGLENDNDDFLVSKLLVMPMEVTPESKSLLANPTTTIRYYCGVCHIGNKAKFPRFAPRYCKHCWIAAMLHYVQTAAGRGVCIAQKAPTCDRKAKYPRIEPRYCHECWEYLDQCGRCHVKDTTHSRDALVLQQFHRSLCHACKNVCTKCQLGDRRFPDYNAKYCLECWTTLEQCPRCHEAHPHTTTYVHAFRLCDTCTTKGYCQQCFFEKATEPKDDNPQHCWQCWFGVRLPCWVPKSEIIDICIHCSRDTVKGTVITLCKPCEHDVFPDLHLCQQCRTATAKHPPNYQRMYCDACWLANFLEQRKHLRYDRLCAEESPRQKPRLESGEVVIGKVHLHNSVMRRVDAATIAHTTIEKSNAYCSKGLIAQDKQPQEKKPRLPKRGTTASWRIACC